MFAGYAWRSRHEAILTAYHVAAYTLGTESLPDLSELLDETGAAEATPEEYHKRMKELGLE